jgi:hypothetical protein
MRGQDAHLTLVTRKHDGIDLIGKDAGFWGDDFEFERHSGKGFRFQVSGFKFRCGAAWNLKL